MRTRKTIAILGVGLILACCVMIYLMMDLTLFPPGQGPKLSINDVCYVVGYCFIHVSKIRYYIVQCKNCLFLLESVASF